MVLGSSSEGGAEVGGAGINTNDGSRRNLGSSWLGNSRSSSTSYGDSLEQDDSDWSEVTGDGAARRLAQIR